jgi:serine phosphatase RsbU (regulator of sigma subunit)
MSSVGELRPKLPALLLVVGAVAFAVAALSVADMYLPHPYDGVVLEADAPGQLIVREVIPGSGAELAGIAPGDQIVGIARSALRSSAHAAELLNRYDIGDSVAYLVRTGGRLREVSVRLDQRQIGDTSYLYACFLGFSFFFIGLFVLSQQPRLQASQVFFLLCCLFLVFLVCRLRPASYSWVDHFVLAAGTGALVILPASFLHFFLIFPRQFCAADGVWPLSPRGRRHLLAALYVTPPAVLAATLLMGTLTRRSFRVISGAPVTNWWVLALFVLLGLAVLATTTRRLPDSGERRGAVLVFAGSVLGLLPFLLLAVAFPSFLHTEQFVFWGVIPLALVPLTFAYAIVRYRLLDVRVILRRSLLYTFTTALVTGAYAVGIAGFNALFRGTGLATSRFFPLVLAVSIVLLFEPLRRRLQVPVDRFFFADRTRLQRALLEMGESFTGQLDPAAVVHDLVQELPKLLRLRFAALYLLRGEVFERVAGPQTLPASLPLVRGFFRQLQNFTTLTRIEELTSLRLSSEALHDLVESLARDGVEVLGDLATSRRRIGVVFLSGKDGGLPLEEEELRLLRSLLHQAAIALETSQLLVERAKQAELERELEIAAEIQRSLLPAQLSLGPDWEVVAACRPARHVGGDFYAELPGPDPGTPAILYGDVSGKSVAGALMMMAAKEALHALALAQRDPEELLALANRRLYELRDRSFVALGYFAAVADGLGLRYALAGQPPPLKRAIDGQVSELPLPEHRLPLGAMTRGRHRLSCVTLAPGEVILAFSDGVIEAHSRRGEMFGEERLTQVLAASPPQPRAVVDQVLAALDRFTDGHEPYDDITLIAIARRTVGGALED